MFVAFYMFLYISWMAYTLTYKLGSPKLIRTCKLGISSVSWLRGHLSVMHPYPIVALFWMRAARLARCVHGSMQTATTHTTFTQQHRSKFSQL